MLHYLIPNRVILKYVQYLLCNIEELCLEEIYDCCYHKFGIKIPKARLCSILVAPNNLLAYRTSREYTHKINPTNIIQEIDIIFKLKEKENVQAT